jgi:hypothetical protein
VSGGQNENREIAASVGAPLGIVNHVLDDLEGEGLAEVDSSLGGGKSVLSTSAELRRRLR